MCGRYLLTRSIDEILALFGVTERLNLPPRYNVAPTQAMPVVRTDREGRRRLVMQRWGLVPHWAKDLSAGAKMINARAETVAERPAFRDAFQRRRCLVPADGFYEWKTEGDGPKPVKQPYWIGFEDRRLFAFAGLWAIWRDPSGANVESFTIVTTDANDRLRPLHERMPVILAPADHATWLEGAPEAAAALMRPHDPAEMTAYPVSREVNRVANDDESLPAPLPAEPEPPSQGTLF